MVVQDNVVSPAAVAVGVGDAYDKLKDELVKQAQNLQVGYGLDESTQMEPSSVIVPSNVSRA